VRNKLVDLGRISTTLLLDAANRSGGGCPRPAVKWPVILERARHQMSIRIGVMASGTMVVGFHTRLEEACL
jgi:hypothetical protein